MNSCRTASQRITLNSNMLIVLKGDPLSTGGIYATSFTGKFAHRYLKKQGKDMKESYGWQARAQWKGKPLEGAIFARIGLYFGDKRVRDIDNFHKLSFDALTGIVWLDDSQIQKMIVEKFYDKENPRIEIEIEEMVAKLAPHLVK